MKKIFYTSIFFLLISFIFFQKGIVFAKNKETIRVTPAYISLTGKGGAKYKEDISIFNESKIPVSIKVEKTGIFYNHKKLLYISNNSILNIQNWITFNNASFTLAPQTTINIPVTINVPKNDPYGSYNGALLISNVTKGKNNQSQINGTIVLNVFVNIRGKNKGYSNLIFNFNNPNFFINSTPISIPYTVKNPGPYNNAYIPTISINSIFYQKTINEQLVNVLVKQIRDKEFYIPKIPWGIYNIKIDIKNIGNRYDIKRSFFIINLPYYIYLISIFIIILIIIISIYLKRRSKIKNP